jgi:menaquinone-dependent protoporphyrinogen IX oxidase
LAYRELQNFLVWKSRKTDIKDLAKYDVVILAGGIYASGIAGLAFLRKHIKQLENKRIAVFCVGASPFDEQAFKQVYKHNFSENLSNIPCFYGRGAWNEEKMSFADRTMCKMLQKMVAKKDPTTYEPWEKALMCAVGQSCDWTDKEYLNALLDWIKSEL